MAITVEPDHLGADGLALAGSQSVVVAPECIPPGSDPVSMGAAAHLTARSAGLAALLNHAGSLRAHGGGVVAATAAALQAADTEAAGPLAAVGSSVEPRGVSTGSTPAAAVPALPPEPVLPDVPSMPQLPPLPGRAVADALHSGPGPDGLRSFATEWRSIASSVAASAAQTRQLAAAIADHWVDGQHRAAVNTDDHAGWLDSTAMRARGLADAADDIADHFHHATTQTPTPEDFDRTERWRSSAIVRNAASGGLNAVEVAEANATYACQQAEATNAVGVYQTAVVTRTTTESDTAPHPAPPITVDDKGVTKNHFVDPKDESNDVDAERDQGLGGSVGETAEGKSAPADIVTDQLPPRGVSPRAVAAVPLSALDPHAAGAAGDAAGTATGDSLGALSQLGQLANAMPSAPGGMPGLPTSGLPSMPGLGGLPSVPGGEPTGGEPAPSTPDEGVQAEASPDITSPAGGALGGAGGAGGLPPMAGPLPATMAASPAAAGPLVSTAATTPGATGAGGMGMYPPMLGHGGRGGGDSKERDKRLYPDKRIVVRTVPNTEPVFGELPHEPRRRPNRLKDQEEAE